MEQETGRTLHARKEQSAASELRDLIANIGRELSDLEERLQPYLAPARPLEMLAAIEIGSPGEPGVSDIRAAIHELGDIRTRLVELKGRVE